MSGMEFRGAEPCEVWGCEVYGCEVHCYRVQSVCVIVACGVWKGVALCIAWDGRCRYGGHGGARGRVFEVWGCGANGCEGAGVWECGGAGSVTQGVGCGVSGAGCAVVLSAGLWSLGVDYGAWGCGMSVADGVVDGLRCAR